jgi:hypothetical protein
MQSTAAFESFGSVLTLGGTGRAPLLRQVSNWLMIVDYCAELDQRLAHDTATDGMQFHRAMVGTAIGFGEFLLYRVRTEQPDLTPIGADLPAVERSLQLVWDMFATWHSGMSGERQSEIIQEVFGVAERTA